MSKTFRHDPDYSPLATRRAALAGPTKRERFEERRALRLGSLRSQTLAALDAPERSAAHE